MRFLKLNIVQSTRVFQGQKSNLTINIYYIITLTEEENDSKLMTISLVPHLLQNTFVLTQVKN